MDAARFAKTNQGILLMKKTAFVIALCLASTSLVHAAEITAEKEDTSVGKGFGGLTGLMVGAAAGGPIGALVGAAAGYFAGSGVQKATGTAQTAYLVDTGARQVTVRSPHRRFQPGDKVALVGGRLESAEPATRVSAR